MEVLVGDLLGCLERLPRSDDRGYRPLVEFLGLLIVVAIVAGAIWMQRSPAPSQPIRPASPPPRQPAPRPKPLDAEQFRREWEAEIERQLPAIEAEVEREAAKIHAEAMREAERVASEPWPDDDEEPDEAPLGVVKRSDFVPKEDEARFLTRDENGLPTLRLVDAGDRLAIWSPLDGGALINPKGPGLRRLGLVASYGRGGQYHAAAYRTADLRKGRPVELRAEPDNPHGSHAVAMYAPRARAPFAYVQRGRSRAVFDRLGAGEDMAGVTLWGPGRGSENNTTFVLIGSRADLTAMLDG